MITIRLTTAQRRVLLEAALDYEYDLEDAIDHADDYEYPVPEKRRDLATLRRTIAKL